MREEVCVVGAGGAGLAAGQALAARGIPFRIFEARGGIGGMWRHGETHAYDGLTSNTSRYHTSFRAHRMRLRGRPFIHHTEFLAYLEAFAARFGLDERIEPNARVERAEPSEDGWSVTVEGREPEPFRAVIVATGFLGRPRSRAIPGTFSGHALHSGEYRSPGAFAGKDVVVAGVGTSGAEIAGELVDHARSVTVAVRTGVHVSPKMFPRGVPMDLMDTRVSALLPWSFRRRYVAAVLRIAVGPPEKRGLPVPDHRIFDRVVSVSDTFVRALKRGCFTIRPGIERFDGETVVFADGSAQRADAVIHASGYVPDLSFLPAKLSDLREEHAPLLRGVAHLDAAGLFFVGFVLGHGALLPMLEAQAAWAAAVLAGDVTLPSPSERRRMLSEEAEGIERDFGRPHSIFRDRVRYIAALRREVRASAGRAG
jgi:hypothetical protein